MKNNFIKWHQIKLYKTPIHHAMQKIPMHPYFNLI